VQTEAPGGNQYIDQKEENKKKLREARWVKSK